jgi:hypothetical protein
MAWNYDLLRGDDANEVAAARRRIEKLAAPARDPVGGDGVSRWQRLASPARSQGLEPPALGAGQASERLGMPDG